MLSTCLSIYLFLSSECNTRADQKTGYIKSKTNQDQEVSSSRMNVAPEKMDGAPY